MSEDARRTVRDLRRLNRAALLRPLYLDGPLSRQDLAVVSGLSQPAVSTLIGELIEEGVVAEAGSTPSVGGRPRMLLRVDPDRARVLGVDVGETSLRVELFDLALGLLAKREYPLGDHREPAAVVELVLDGVGTVLAETGVSAAEIIGMGVGVPAVVRLGAQAAVHGQTIGWDGVPLERLLRSAAVTVGSPVADLPIHVDNGATALGQAELWFGAGRGARHAVVLLVGSGVGACVIADGAPYRGATGGAGEWGHTVVQVGGRLCRCGARGCLEAYVGAYGILARYAETPGGRVEPVPAGLGEEAALSWLVGRSADPAVAAVLGETALYLGAGIGALVNLFNSERVVFGGWAGLLLADLLPEVRRVAARHALRQPYAQVTVEMCRLGPDALAKGAATLPVAQFLSRGASTAGVRNPGRTR